jgi:hypothetical protein
MKAIIIVLFLSLLFMQQSSAQEIIPFDTAHWEISAQGYVFENYHGKDAIYLKQGMATPKDIEFLNGTIEFDIYLTDRRSFPGIRFRAVDGSNMESFYFRPHQSGNPDANQANPVMNGLSGWQLYFGPAYSFKYDYNFDAWTHVKLVVNDRKAQIFLDYAEKPNLSWDLKHPPRSGQVAIGGGLAPMHYANFSIDPQAIQMVDFKVKTPEPVTGVIQEWTISDEFGEQSLEDLTNISSLIKERTWESKIRVEENNAANIAQVATRKNPDGNTVFAKITITSERNQWKNLEFGYSDRVVVFLNGEPIYRGDNGFRTRDYRYLGTIGFFDSIYLDLKKGENTLLFAVSENFGGWGITGRMVDQEGVVIE